MQFAEPESIEEAVALLSRDDGARCLAGGATLVAMMNADLVEPTSIISLRRIPDLSGITPAADGSVRIGAMTVHADVAASNQFTGGQRIIPTAAARIGHPAIRNMGTIGGSLAHADPSADHPTAVTAADAMIELTGPDGRRLVPAGEFFVDWFETARSADEIITAIIVPASKDAVAGYEKFNRADGDFATVSVAVVMFGSAGRCASARVVVGGCGATPVHVGEADAVLAGTTLDPHAVAEAGRLLAEACDPIDDMRGSTAYRLKLVPRIVARVIEGLRDQVISGAST